VISFWIVFALLGLNTLESFRQISRAIALIRTRYEPIWVELGRPTSFWNNSPQHLIALQGFLWSDRAAKLDDAELSRLARRIRAATITQCLLLPAATIAMLLGAQG
jgi:hypothetical protein